MARTSNVMKLSVIICTYNPQETVFKKCLHAVQSALANLDDAEVLIIDNNSSVPVEQLPWISRYLDRRWRIMVEDEQGLTPARLRGIKESKGDLLVFVDDDNFVRSDFFERGLDIARDKTYIGAYSGQVNLVFEVEPEAWTERYWGMLVFRRFEKDLWSNLPHLEASMPCGAGLFVHRQVALFYLSLHIEGKRKIKLDRSGTSLLSAGDNDLAACACDLGLGVGLFSSLWLDHYIPAKRLTKPYLLALAKGIAASTIVFKSYRQEFPVARTMKNKIADGIRLIMKDGISRDFHLAVLDGEALGRKLLEENS
jgi:glycosyltransferase involved in cell wall biosynthesis